jgi:hypothetical protein
MPSYKKRHDSILKFMKNEKKKCCAMCGTKGHSFRTARSSAPFTTYNGKTLWITTTYTLNHIDLGFGNNKDNIAGVCKSCTRKLHIRCATWAWKSILQYKILKFFGLYDLIFRWKNRKYLNSEKTFEEVKRAYSKK